MFVICVENLVRIGEKANLILRLKKILLNNFNNSRKADLQFNIVHSEYSL